MGFLIFTKSLLLFSLIFGHCSFLVCVLLWVASILKHVTGSFALSFHWLDRCGAPSPGFDAVLRPVDFWRSHAARFYLAFFKPPAQCGC